MKYNKICHFTIFYICAFYVVKYKKIIILTIFEYMVL